MELWIVRHGQTQGNAKRLLQGHQPGKLSQLGIDQARTTGIRLSKENFEGIYVSDLGRTRETYDNIALSFPDRVKEKVKVTYTSLIREKGGGILEGQPLDTWRIQARDSGIPLRKFKCIGGESWEDVNDRAERFLESIIKTHFKGESCFDEPQNQLTKSNDNPSETNSSLMIAKEESKQEENHTRVMKIQGKKHNGGGGGVSVSGGGGSSGGMGITSTSQHKAKSNSESSDLKFVGVIGSTIPIKPDIRNIPKNNRTGLPISISNLYEPKTNIPTKKDNVIITKGIIQSTSTSTNNTTTTSPMTISTTTTTSISNTTSTTSMSNRIPLHKPITTQKGNMNTGSIAESKGDGIDSSILGKYPKLLVVTHGGYIMELLNVISKKNGTLKPSQNNDALNCSITIIVIYCKLTYDRCTTECKNNDCLVYRLCKKNDVAHL